MLNMDFFVSLVSDSFSEYSIEIFKSFAQALEILLKYITGRLAFTLRAKK